MLKKRFENAFQFLASYFHQDFGDEFGEPEKAVKKFNEQNPPEVRKSVIAELEELLEEYSEPDLPDVLFELGCYYDPMRHRGQPYGQWLRAVIEMIQQ
jgi:hypothetical protein